MTTVALLLADKIGWIQDRLQQGETGSKKTDQEIKLLRQGMRV